MIDQEIADRFQNLLSKGQRILSRFVISNKGQRDRVEHAPFLEWQSQSLTLLGSIFGPEHSYMKSFESATSHQGIAQANPASIQIGWGSSPPQTRISPRAGL